MTSVPGRPPRSSPVTVAETKSEFPERKLSTAPFVAEMTTLAALCLHALPFGIISDQIPDVRIVHCYHMGFEGIDLQPGRLPVFILVFTAPDLDVPNLRELLLSDEKDAKGHDATRARAGGSISSLRSSGLLTEGSPSSGYVRM